MNTTDNRYSLAAARQSFATLLARASLGRERFRLTRRGIDVAALVGSRDLADLEQLDQADAPPVWDSARPSSPRAAREQLADKLANVEAGQRVAIEKRGRVYAGLIPVADLDRLEARGAAVRSVIRVRADTKLMRPQFDWTTAVTVSAILAPEEGPAIVAELTVRADSEVAGEQTLVEVRSTQTPRFENHEAIVEAIQSAAMQHAEYGPTPAGFTYTLSFDRSRDGGDRSLANAIAQMSGLSIQAPAFLAASLAMIGGALEPDVLSTGALFGSELGSVDRKIATGIAMDMRSLVAPERDREAIVKALEDNGLTVSGNRAHGQRREVDLRWFGTEESLYGIAKELCGESVRRTSTVVPQHQPARTEGTIGSLWLAALLGKNASLSVVEQAFFEHLGRPGNNSGPGLSKPLQPLQQEFMAKCLDKSGEENPFVSDRHLLLSGGTSSGKTTLMEILSVATALSDSRRNKVLYIAPTRALAQLRHAELTQRYGGFRPFSPTGRRPVIIATGEDNLDDWRLRSGDFSIGVLVYEKANVLAQIQRNLLDQVGLVVIDEAHMLSDLDRGPMLEMFLLKALHRRGEQEKTAEERGNRKLRVAVISTESLHANLMRPHALIDLLSETRVLTGERSLPIVVAQPFRPGKIVHYFVLPKRDAPGHFRARIAEFDDAVSRTLTTEQIADVEAEIHEREVRYFDSLGPVGRQNVVLFKSEPTERLFSLLKWIKERYRGSPRRVLVFMPSIQAIKSTANRLKKSLAGAAQQEIDSDLQSELDDLDDAQEKKNFIELTSAGVFIHHAGVDRQLRDKIAALWSQPYKDGDVQFLFATETLSFGVNLSIDDVIMYGTRVFSAPRNRNKEGVRAPYTPCEFHNMIGRAGRLGLRNIDEAANVYVLPAGEDQAREILRAYYLNPAGLPSNLFVEDDVVLDRSAEAERKVNDLSHAFVHAILDLLRFLTPIDSGAASVEDLASALESYSLFCRQIINEPSADETLKRLRQSIETVLEGCSAGPEDMRLVERVSVNKPTRYRLTQKGRDVLDTGTEIQTILPLTLLTLAIERDAWNKENDAEELPMPGELAVLAVVAQRECFRSVQKAVPEARLETQPNSARIEANTAGVFELFVSTLEELVPRGSRRLAAHLSDLILRFCQEQNVARPELRRDAILRVYSMMLLWIDGRRLQEVRKPVEILHPRAEQQQFNPNINSFSERLSWKLELLSRLMAPKYEPGLTDMISRLRLGCPTEAVTLLLAQPGLKRRRATEIARNNGSPDQLLRLGHVDLPADTISPARQLRLLVRLREGAGRAVNELIAEIANRPGAKPSKHVNAVEAFGRENFISTDIGAFFGEGSFTLPTHLLQEIATSQEVDIWSPDGDMGTFEVEADNVLWAGDQNGRSLDMVPDEYAGGFMFDDHDEEGDRLFTRLLVLGIRSDCSVVLSGDIEARSFADVLAEEDAHERLLIAVTPWLPHPSAWPPEVIAALQKRRAAGKSTTFMTAPALCVLLVMLGREFDTPQSLVYSHLRPGSIGVISVRGLRERMIGVPEFPGAIRRAMAKFNEIGTSIPEALRRD